MSTEKSTDEVVADEQPETVGSKLTRWHWFAIVAVVSCVADQVSKVWARNSLETGYDGRGIPVVVIENFFDWRLSHNPGSAFGLFGGTSGARIFLSLIGVVAVGAIIWMVKKARPDQRRLIWALGLVAGGAVGNLIDRIYFGVVTDFVVWKYHDTEWPTFNIADVALVVGVALLFLDIGKEAKIEAAEKKSAEEKKKKSGAPKKKSGGSKKKKKR
jgi:signal peptidase II